MVDSRLFFVRLLESLGKPHDEVGPVIRILCSTVTVEYFVRKIVFASKIPPGFLVSRLKIWFKKLFMEEFSHPKKDDLSFNGSLAKVHTILHNGIKSFWMEHSNFYEPAYIGNLKTIISYVSTFLSHLKTRILLNTY